MTADFIFCDEPAQGLKRGDLQGIFARLGTPKESTLSDGTKVSEFPGGSVLIQTPFREDGWLSQALGECAETVAAGAGVSVEDLTKPIPEAVAGAFSASAVARGAKQ